MLGRCICSVGNLLTLSTIGSCNEVLGGHSWLRVWVREGSRGSTEGLLLRNLDPESLTHKPKEPFSFCRNILLPYRTCHRVSRLPWRVQFPVKCVNLFTPSFTPTLHPTSVLHIPNLTPRFKDLKRDRPEPSLRTTRINLNGKSIYWGTRHTTYLSSDLRTKVVDPTLFTSGLVTDPVPPATSTKTQTG